MLITSPEYQKMHVDKNFLAYSTSMADYVKNYYLTFFTLSAIKVCNEVKALCSRCISFCFHKQPSIDIMFAFRVTVDSCCLLLLSLIRGTSQHHDKTIFFEAVKKKTGKMMLKKRFNA